LDVKISKSPSKSKQGPTSIAREPSSKPRKLVQVFVEANVEFFIEIRDDPLYTCGWLQSEVVRKYYEVLEKQAYEQQQ